MSDLALWQLLWMAFGLGSVFILGCAAALWFLERLPSVQRFLDQLIGGDGDCDCF